MAWLPDIILDLLVRLLEWADEKVEFAIYNKHVKKWHKRLHE